MTAGRKFALAAGAVLVVLILGYALWPTGKDSKPSIRLIGEAYAPLDALAQLKGEFEAETGIQVDIVQKDHQSVVAELDQELATRNVTYDIVLMPHRLLGKLVEKQQVRPLDDLITDDSGTGKDLLVLNDAFSRWWKEVSWYKGKPYGAPFSLLSMYVVYRRDLFDDPENQEQFRAKYGHDLRAPATWNEYVEIAEFFHNPEAGRYGTYIQGQQHVALWYEWLNVLYAFKADVLDSSVGSSYGDIVVNSPEAKAATRAYVDLMKFSPPETRNYNWDDALAVLQSGKCVMGILWHDATPYLEDLDQTDFAGKFGYCPVPGSDGEAVAQLEGWTYLIPTESKHPNEAARFLAWAMSQDVQLEQTLKGGASPRPSVYEKKLVQEIPFMPTFLKCVEVGKVKPTFPESAIITETLVRRLSQILAGELSVDDGLDTAAKDINEILEGKCKMRYPTE